MLVSAQSPLPARLLAWAGERFQAVNGVFCMVLYGAALTCGRASAPGPLALAPLDIAGFFAAYAFLLMLRVYDEHKDYELDMKNHPQRVLQRGLITLGHLKVAGALAILLQLVVSLAYDGFGLGAVLQRWLLVFVWSALMAKEFFISEWLGKRLVLYAVSHMVVMPMSVLWMVQMGAGQGPLPRAAWLLAGLSFLSGSAFEIGRKTRAPQDERETVDSYSKTLGLSGAVAALLTVSAMAGALLLWLLSEVGGALSPLGIAAALVAAALPVAPLLRFLRAPSSKGAKLNEAALGMQALICYVALSGTLLLQRGALWR